MGCEMTLWGARDGYKFTNWRCDEDCVSGTRFCEKHLAERTRAAKLTEGKA